MTDSTRRGFLAAGSIGVAGIAGLAWGDEAPVANGVVDEAFPSTEAARALEFVGAAHFRIDRVREMLAEEPGLALASWDWGFGDWESAIGAASHTGQRAIIELLVEHGARPTHFTMAALDQIDALRAFLGANPSAEGLEGPHSISLYDHARAGKASRVLEFLEARGLNRPNPFRVERSEVEQYFGEYAWGDAEGDRFQVDWMERMSSITLRRPGQVSRNLIPLDEHVFAPAGARHARLRFEMDGDRAARLIVPKASGPLVATRRP